MKTNEMQLIIDGHNGIFVPKVFCDNFANYIKNKEELKEDIAICSSSPKHADYWEAWDNLLDNVILVDDNGIECTIIQNGDLWSLPVGMELPEDFFEN